MAPTSHAPADRRLGHTPFEGQGPLIDVAKMDGVVPLEPTLGAFGEAAAVTSPLYDRLFAEDGKRCFAVVDAAKVPNLAETLGASPLRSRCLFTGAALEDFAYVAPWLIELEKDAPLTRALLSADETGPSPWALWDTEPGIFLRCEAEFDLVWRHLRKFTRLETDNKRWVYFRFWDADLGAVFARYPDQLARFWSRFLAGAELVIPDQLLGLAHIVRSPNAQAGAAHSGGAVTLADVPEHILRTQTRVVMARSFVRAMQGDPDMDVSGVSKLPLPEQLARIEADIGLAQRDGMVKRDHIFRFVMLVHQARLAQLPGASFTSRARNDWTSFPPARKIAELEFDLKDILGAADT